MGTSALDFSPREWTKRAKTTFNNTTRQFWDGIACKYAARYYESH